MINSLIVIIGLVIVVVAQILIGEVRFDGILDAEKVSYVIVKHQDQEPYGFFYFLVEIVVAFECVEIIANSPHAILSFIILCFHFFTLKILKTIIAGLPRKPFSLFLHIRIFLSCIGLLFYPVQIISSYFNPHLDRTSVLKVLSMLSTHIVYEITNLYARYISITLEYVCDLKNSVLHMMWERTVYFLDFPWFFCVILFCNEININACYAPSVNGHCPSNVHWYFPQTFFVFLKYLWRNCNVFFTPVVFEEARTPICENKYEIFVYLVRMAVIARCLIFPYLHTFLHVIQSVLFVWVDKLEEVSHRDLKLRRGECCAVCREEFDTLKSVKKLPCQHMMHTECLVRYILTFTTCPLCRRELNTVRFHTQLTEEQHDIRRKMRGILGIMFEGIWEEEATREPTPFADIGDEIINPFSDSFFRTVDPFKDVFETVSLLLSSVFVLLYPSVIFFLSHFGIWRSLLVYFLHFFFNYATKLALLFFMYYDFSIILGSIAAVRLVWLVVVKRFLF